MFKNLFLRNAVKGWVMSPLGPLGIRNLLDTHPLSKIPGYATELVYVYSFLVDRILVSNVPRATVRRH